MNQRVRKLTDGAMMAAIAGVMLLINRQTAELLESLFLFIFPLPMVFYSAKYGRKDSWIVFAAIVLLAFILGTIQTVVLTASESFIGLMYGSGIHDHVNSRKLVLRTMLAAVMVDLFSMLIFASFFGYDVAREISEYKEVINEAFAQSGQTISSTIDLDNFLMTIFIVSTILTGVLEGYITHILSRLMLKRLRFHVDPPTPISAYYPPKWSGYAGMAGVVMYYYAVYHPLENEIVQSIFLGLGIAGIIYLAFYGFICMLLFGSRSFPRARVMITIISFLLMIISSPLMAILGFLYISADFHNRIMEGGS